MVAVCGCLLFIWMRHGDVRRARGMRPWTLPAGVVTGVVDADRGLRGTIEFGMSRDQALRNLGKPLVGRLSSEEALPRGLDPEHTQDDYFGREYVLAHYYGDDRVATLEFDLDLFNRWFRQEQAVTLLYRGMQYRFDRRTSRSEALSQLLAHRAPVKEHSDSIELPGRSTVYLSFGPDQALSSVLLVGPDPTQSGADRPALTHETTTDSGGTE